MSKSFFVRIWCPRCKRLYREPRAARTPNTCPFCFYGHWSDTLTPGAGHSAITERKAPPQ